MIKDYFRKLPFPPYYLLIGVLLICLVLGMNTFFDKNFSYGSKGETSFSFNIFIVPIVNFSFWAVLSPVVFQISELAKFSKKSIFRDFGITLVSGLVLALFHEVTTTIMYYGPRLIINYDEYSEWIFELLNFKYLTTGASSRFIEYIGIFTLFAALKFYRISTESKVKLQSIVNELQAAQLQTLKMQLQPHFLFNTLNTISALIEEDQEKAITIVSKLGDLLRNILALSDQTEITLDEELRLTRYYLDIEETRYADRLLVTYEVDEDLLSLNVPTLILQPLVENALKHGFEGMTNNCKLHIRVFKSPHNMYISIKDNGVNTPEFNESEIIGMGIKNVRERLEKHYGHSTQLKLIHHAGKSFESLIILKNKS